MGLGFTENIKVNIKLNKTVGPNLKKKSDGPNQG